MKTLTSLVQSPIPRALMAGAWSTLLTILLLQAEAAPVIDLGLPRGDNTILRELAFSTLHLVAFAFTCSIWHWTLMTRWNLQRSLRAACVIALALGLSTEFLQSFTQDRHFSWLDLSANIAGAMLAARMLRRRSARPG